MFRSIAAIHGRFGRTARTPTALTAIYLMKEDLIVVDAVGKIVCLARRDLTPRWVSTLKHPLSAPPAEGPLHPIGQVGVAAIGQHLFWRPWLKL